MSRRSVLPDPDRFARKGQKKAGRAALCELERLADLLAETRGEVEWSIEGVQGADGRPLLRLDIRAVPVLICQRCLGPLEHAVERASLLRPVEVGTPIDQEELENDEFDTIEVGAGLDVLELVEDEILLALPIVPRHEQCGSPHAAGGSKKESPFDVLANLRGRSKRE